MLYFYKATRGPNINVGKLWLEYYIVDSEWADAAAPPVMFSRLQKCNIKVSTAVKILKLLGHNENKTR